MSKKLRFLQVNKVLVFLLTQYNKLLSPVLARQFGNACRFTPTCSTYTIEALKRFGVVKGLSLGIKRIVKCHPWTKTGHDPVPNK